MLDQVDSMKTIPRRFGAHELGRIGLGTAPLGNLFAPVSEEDAVHAVRRALALGVRYIDTAPHYGNGLSEHRVATALRGVERETFVLSTKVGRLLSPDPGASRNQHGFVGGQPFRQRFDYSHDGALRSIEDSLQRLGLARVDIALIHDIDVFTHGAEAQPQRFREAMDGAYRALARLKAEGAIGAVGLGVNDWRVCLEALKHGDFDGFLLAGRYTLIDQSALAELLPVCQRRGTSVIIGGPYNSGILARGAVAGATYDYRPAEAAILERVRALTVVCATFDVPLQAAALQFPLGHPAVLTVLPGARSPAEVEANLRFAAHPIPADFWLALRDARLLASDAPLPIEAA
jgi:D-threo-aldose 1-dehydrogenase